MTTPNQNITIKQAMPEQATELSELAVRSKAHWGYSEQFMTMCHQELLVTQKCLVSGSVHYYVAKHGDELIGFYALEQVSSVEFELDALFVDPGHVGQGVGKALISHAKQLLKNLGGQVMKIQGDPNASAFYLAMGGELIGLSDSLSIPGRQLPLFKIAV